VWCWPLVSIHDQLIFEVEEDAAQEVDSLMKWRFNSVMDDIDTGERLFRVPIGCDGEIMERWKKE